jgi:hypothetical protein
MEWGTYTVFRFDPVYRFGRGTLLPAKLEHLFVAVRHSAGPSDLEFTNEP